MKTKEKILLCLEDDSTFEGYSFGAKSSVSGEVVFNTGMVGYPETLTDPSYKGQILVLTYPLIGNYGVPRYEKDKFGLEKNFESEKPQISGLVVSDYSQKYSHWNAKKSLGEWLEEENIPGVYGIDTRALTKKLREKGSMLGKIIYKDKVRLEDPNKRNLVKEASIENPLEYRKGKKKVILVDCGVKNNIIRALVMRGLTIKRVPWNYDFLDEQMDGVVISNGPGDPKKCQETIYHLEMLLERDLPVLGICLGSQILGLAAGANTYKLKYGHRSHNQPCIEVGTKRCYITSQNHGYAVNSETLPEDWREWFSNNNDKTNEGIIHISKPFFGAQFHPEASPGPQDTEFIFDMFLRAMR